MVFRGKLGQLGSVGKIGGSIKSGAQKGWSGAKSVGGGAKTAAVAGGSFMGGLALGAAGKAKKRSGNFIIILSFILFLVDRAVGYKGFYITGMGSFFEILKLFTSLLYVVGVWALFYFFMSKDRSPRALVTFVVAMIAVLITIALSFKLDRLSILHVAFILLLWFTYIKNRDDAPTANLTLIGLLIADLYLYSIVMGIAPQFAQYVAGFPILFFLTIAYVYQETNSKLAWILIFSVVAWYFITTGPALAEKLNTAGIEGVQTRIPSLKEFASNFKKKNIDEPITKLKDGIGAWLSSQISYAISGKVEQNQREPLGVYLEDVQSADPRYYEDEDVIVWGTVKARTLDDPINIKVGCFVTQDKNKVYAEVDPKDKFSVFTSEEQDFACKFKACKEEVRSKCALKTSANTVTAFADFNFETLAELKVYFMNQERIRAMSRENQDPLDELEIKDKKPVAIYTNGPAELLMGTTSPLIGVSANYTVYPTVDFSVKNRDGWQGRINNLKELVLFLPEGIELSYNTENKIEPCNKKFEPYRPEECRESCKTFVFNECNEVCESGNCDYNCDEVKAKCESVCDSLFDVDGQKYNGYALDLNDTRVRNEMKDFDKFKLFRCRFKPDPSKVLGSSPITTKFFRIKARYNYTVESPVTVIIDKIPDELKETATPPSTTPPSTTPAEIPSELGQPDANGIYRYEAPEATPIWYRYISGAWQWTPYEPPTDIWMPVTTTIVTAGSWKDEKPVQENIDIINYLAKNNPTPPTTPPSTSPSGGAATTSFTIGEISPLTAGINEAKIFSAAISGIVKDVSCQFYAPSSPGEEVLNKGDMTISGSTATISYTFSTPGDYSVYAYCMDITAKTAQGKAVTITVQ